MQHEFFNGVHEIDWLVVFPYGVTLEARTVAIGESGAYTRQSLFLTFTDGDVWEYQHSQGFYYPFGLSGIIEVLSREAWDEEELNAAFPHNFFE